MKLKILFTLFILSITACSLYQTEGRKVIEKGEITLTKKNRKLFPKSEHCYKTSQLSEEKLGKILHTDNRHPLFQTHLEAYSTPLRSLDYRLVFLTEKSQTYYVCDFVFEAQSPKHLSNSIEELELYSYQVIKDHSNRP